MISCEYLEMLIASPEPIEVVRNVSIILSGLCAYWLGVVVRVGLLNQAEGRRWLANSVLAVPVSFAVVPPLLFMASRSTDLGSFLAALAASFACGTVINEALVAHLDQLGFDL